MKYLVSIFLLILSLCCCSDDKNLLEESNLEFGKEINLKSGDNLHIDKLDVFMDSITSDSRCPSDVNCIWEGNASIRFNVTISDEVHIVTLNTNGKNNFPSDTILNLYSFELINLRPYPLSTLSINQNDYEATIIVKELED